MRITDAAMVGNKNIGAVGTDRKTPEKNSVVTIKNVTKSTAKLIIKISFALNALYERINDTFLIVLLILSKKI